MEELRDIKKKDLKEDRLTPTPEPEQDLIAGTDMHTF